MDLAERFYRGQFKDLVEATIGPAKEPWPAALAHYVIGALSFLGRIDDALVLFRKHRADLDPTGLAAARFFVGIGLVRVSRYEEGERVLAENLAAAGRPRTPPVARFYAHQGVAFFRYFQNRYARSLAAARHAWEAALEGDYIYGQSLAAELRAHALVRTGNVAAGLEAFDEVARMCERHQLGKTANSALAAQFDYRSQHGLLGAETVPALERFVASFSPQDNFTLAVAQTALAHQLAIRGQMRRSEGLLAEAARVILKAGHHRHAAMVLHKLAHNRYYMGRFAEAKELLDKAEAELDPRFDLNYLLGVNGLRLKIARRLGEPTEALAALVTRLTARVGSGVGRNTLWRELGLGTPTLRGDDVLGDLRHRTRHGEATPYADVLQVVAAGHLGFLHEVLPRGAESRMVVFDLLPQRITVVDDGEVTTLDEPVSAALKGVALQIARTPATKRELIEAHWGFVYHALRHDPLVYAVINRLRKALGPAAAWLQYEGGAYEWLPGVRVFTYEPQGLGEAAHLITHAPQVEAPAPVAGEAAHHPDLNRRQLAILSELARRDGLDVQDCVKLFGISRITAYRDLGELTKRGLATRRGKGRATSYHRT